MTEKEQDLLNKAIEVLNLNSGFALSGSLLLAFLGIDKRREASDIDLVCPKGQIDNFKCPEGEKQDESGSDLSCISVKVNGIKYDVLETDEQFEVVNGILCGSVDRMLEAKYKYSQQDNNDALKHYLDLQYLNYDFAKHVKADIELLF